MTQSPLFLESIYDALRAIVEHAGGGKVVGHALFPAKSPEDARKALLDSLNASRPEKLDPEQIVMLLRIGREAGFHGAKHWLDAETGYSLSDPVDPDDRAAALTRTVKETAEALRHATDALERFTRGRR